LHFSPTKRRKEKKDNPVVAAAGANNKTNDSTTKPKSASWKQMITSSKPKTKWALGILDIKIATFHGSSSSSFSHLFSKVETSSGAITPPTNPILSLLTGAAAQAKKHETETKSSKLDCKREMAQREGPRT